MRLDQRLVAEKFFLTRQQAIAAIKEGLVRVNEKIIFKPSHRTKEEDVIQVRKPSPEKTSSKPSVLFEVPIVYEEETFLVVEKKAGVIVHGGPHIQEPTLVDALRALNIPLPSSGPRERAGIIHRLDKETSGLMVIAKTDEAQLKLQKMMQEKQFEKKYYVLVHGRPRQSQGEMETGFGRNPRQRHKMCVLPRRKNVRIAKTFYRVLCSSSSFSLLEVIISTGRTHQIRVHLSSLGHPVAGDKTYGKKSDSFPRQMLHAYFLSFPHPESQKRLSFQSPLPEDFQLALKQTKLSMN